MKIKLACPSEWFERPGMGGAGETVDVEPNLAETLVRQGYAQFTTLTADNVDLAAQMAGVDLGDARTVTQKKAAVKAATSPEG